MTVTIHQAKTHLSRLIHHVEQGEEVVVCRGKLPVAKIIRTSASQPVRPKVGQATSPRFAVPDNAFAPLSQGELKDWGL
jgi:antitoxin (DNA-binding transcriptional repressor) of toxin-antitoxin stability system